MQAYLALTSAGFALAHGAPGGLRERYLCDLHGSSVVLSVAHKTACAEAVNTRNRREAARNGSIQLAAAGDSQQIDAGVDDASFNSVALWGVGAVKRKHDQLQLTQEGSSAESSGEASGSAKQMVQENILKFVDQASPADIKNYRELQMLAITAGNLSLSVWDKPEMKGLLSFMRPKLALEGLTYDMIR